MIEKEFILSLNPKSRDIPPLPYENARPSGGFEGHAQRGILSPTDHQPFIQTVQTQEETNNNTRQLADFPNTRSRNQAVAVDAQERVAPFAFQAGERFFDLVFTGGRAHGDVLELRLEVEDIRDGDQHDTALLIDR